jgi:tetratricopeptide (TPR) repeat protein
VKEAMPVIERTYPSPSLQLWFADRNASLVMRAGGHYREAELYARKCLAVGQAANMPEGDPRIGNSWQALGEALASEKKYAESIDALQRASTAYQKAGPVWAKKPEAMARRIAEIRAQAQGH